jgi:drug/metabolite transporter (DMT)-like permease
LPAERWVKTIKNFSSMVLVFCTVVLTSYAQLIVKWRVSRAGPLPVALVKKALFLTGLLFDPLVVTGLLAALLAGLSWMAAMTRLELSFAYPFISLSFVLVFIFSAFLFHETITAPKVVGMLFIIAGIIVISRG